MAACDESSVRAARDLRVLFSRLRRRLREFAAADDLTPPQTAVLLRLVKDGPASVSQLAGAERVRPQSMAATVAGLDRHGLIDRRPDPDDGRRQLIELTAVGRHRAENDRRARDEWLVRAMQDRYSERERQMINEALTLLNRLND
ncbi:MarR family winged helix-turn-helix transcriptional regulator [Mycolicibacter icosiumassiliensis]|uniref:MarR family winged helix-turn-helix transcriptional regulator n=1 Tax=Mycolicibacter icosiumassiliensis TaxID=1792835 RepID=UPI000833FA9D|nr:MarR family transcriptional regulator [Mycolicibacter icosiumassiliensis]